MLLDRRLLTIIVFSMVFFVMISAVCMAQEWSRKGKGEWFVFGQSMSGDTTTGTLTPKVTITLDDTNAFGFGFGKNFDDYLNGNMEMYFGSMDVTGKGKVLGKTVTVKGDTSLLGINFNLDINVLKSRFTPLVTGGIGFIRFTGDIEGFPFDETDLSYNIGAGFRWDVTNNFLIKGIYRSTSTKLEDTDKSISLDGINFTLGYIF